MSPQSQTSPAAIEQYISFALNNKIEGMIPTQQLVETLNLDLASIVQIPDMNAAVIGVCSWRGEVLWLLDLSYLLGFEPLLTPQYQQPKCSILRVTNQGNTIGLLVAEVKQLIRCQTTEIEAKCPSFISSERANLISGTFTNTQKKQVLLLDLAAIIQSLNT